MKRYEKKKVKSKHAHTCYEMSSCEKCLNTRIDYLKEVKKGLIVGSAFAGTLSLIGLSSIWLVKDNNIEQISLDIILSACAAGISYCLVYDVKEKTKQLKKLERSFLQLKNSVAKDISNNDDEDTTQNVYALK